MYFIEQIQQLMDTLVRKCNFNKRNKAIRTNLEFH